MMSTQMLNTSVVNADSKKGQGAVAIFRAQYNNAQLDEDGAQILNEHSGFAAYLLTGIRRFSTKAPDYTVARSILGNDFITPKEVGKERGVRYSEEMLLAYGNSLPSQEDLEWCRTNNMMLVPGPVNPTALLGVRDLDTAYFYSKTEGWYANADQKFSREDKAESGWLALRKEPVQGSLNQNWTTQSGLVVSPMIVPNAGEFTWVTTTFKAVRGIYLFPNVYVRTSSLDSDGFHVIVGYFDAKGLIVNNWDYDDRDSGIGVSSARKWPLKF